MGLVDDNVFPKIIESMNTTDPAAPVDATWKVYAKAGGIYARSSNSVVGPFAAASAGNYTGVLWSSGTSMPGGPVTNQRITRTDLGLDCYYDGSQWLTVNLYRESFGAGEGGMPLTANNSAGRLTPWSTTFDIWVDAFYASNYVLTTNDGSKFWTIALSKTNAAAVDTTIVSYTTAADTASTWTLHRVAAGTSIASATFKAIQIVATKTSTPGNLYIACSMSYRLIVT